MARKRVTERFPFLLPLRQWQRKKCFYGKMRLDGARYANRFSGEPLPDLIFESALRMVNEDSGFDIQYQYNKVHNLKLAAAAMDGVLIRPGETFSFWQLARWAERDQPYRDGLVFQQGRIVPARGGGLCMLSDLLFWCFLHTPLTIVERHGHSVESFPAVMAEGQPCGTDATISEGWRDLKVRNDTEQTFQIEIVFDERDITGRIRSDAPARAQYRIYAPEPSYARRQGKVIRTAEIWREETDRADGGQTRRRLYTDRCEIAYPLPEGTPIAEK